MASKLPTKDARTEYEGEMEARLAKLGSDIDSFLARTKGKLESSGVAVTAMAEQLQARRKEARARLDELRKSSGEAWAELQEGMERAWMGLNVVWGNFRRACGRAASKFEKGEDT